VTFVELRTDIVILACAVSAGIHAALIPDHFQEGAGAGVGFVVAAVLLALLAVILTWRPSQAALVATMLVFAGLIVSYALVLTTGVPVLHPDVEAVDGLAVFTKAVEVAGAAVAADLIRWPSFIGPQPKGTLT
jgi:drug/metabolite transporter (DMT)-like permease